MNKILNLNEVCGKFTDFEFTGTQSIYEFHEYLILTSKIPGGMPIADATTVALSTASVVLTSRNCGSFINPATGTAINVSVCSKYTFF